MRIDEIDTSYRDNLAKHGVSFKQLPDKEKQLKHIIKTQCSDILTKYKANNSLGIFKGTIQAKTSTPFFGNTLLWKRKSANTINLFTSLIDILPSWKNTAKRSQSLICTTSETTARSYGGDYTNVWRIFPYNDVLISVGKTSDFWTNFGSRDIEGEFRNVSRILNMYQGSPFGGDEFSSYMSPELLRKMNDYMNANMKKMLDFFWKNKEGHWVYPQLFSLLNEIKEKGGLLAWADWRLNPETHNIFTYSPAEFPLGGNLLGSKEVWFSGRFIAIPVAQELNYVGEPNEW